MSLSNLVQFSRLIMPSSELLAVSAALSRAAAEVVQSPSFAPTHSQDCRPPQSHW